MLLPVRSVPSPMSATSPHPSEFRRVTRSQMKHQLARNNDCVPDARTSESDQADTASHRPGLHPQSSVLPCRGESSLDLDEDEVSVLLEESVVLGPGSAASRCSEGGGYEADSSDSDARPASSPQRSVSLPRWIARHRVQPAWMRTGEWDVHWGGVQRTGYVVLV